GCRSPSGSAEQIEMSAMTSEPKGVRPPLDLSKWRNVPLILMAGGGLLALIGFFVDRDQFAFSWLQAFMFSLSLCLGALFLVIMHHLFDAGWSVPIRRFCEHIATLSFPVLLFLFIPIAFLSHPCIRLMDEGLAARVVLDHVWRLLLRW